MLVPGTPPGHARLPACVDCNPKILKPAEKKAKYPYGGGMGRQMTPPRGKKKKDAQKL